ncbi:MAG: hypothetical protein DI602_02890 [Aliarcobacter butzleri]|nr:MAG: hypothetical protein DI602_02890 [Aliarcobacter butzleri]
MFKNSTLFEKNFLLAKTAPKFRGGGRNCFYFCFLITVSRSIPYSKFYTLTIKIFLSLLNSP